MTTLAKRSRFVPGVRTLLLVFVVTLVAILGVIATYVGERDLIPGAMSDVAPVVAPPNAGDTYTDPFLPAGPRIVPGVE
jgi:hypothetical protein